MSLRVAWIKVEDAKAFVREHHRHLKPSAGAIVCLGAWKNGALVGVAMIGRPVARRDGNDGSIIEITRTATDGTRNANSKLYGAAKRLAQLLGATKLKTKTLPWESGASLKAAGFRKDGVTKGGKWSRAGRERKDEHYVGPKQRWVFDLEEAK